MLMIMVRVTINLLVQYRTRHHTGKLEYGSRGGV